ncbi:MAG: IreB family regulatory phosphoprotein [Oscillospiraceae bacterium]|nr:IreB family regulatory phosphoprotein [Oscillospiraceae bacterium]
MTLDDYTRKFNVISKENQTKEILSAVYEALRVKGYDPINQIIGYIVSEDPTYITNYNGARSLICRLDRDELLEELLTAYLKGK